MRVYSRSTEPIPEPLDFSAGSGGNNFESSFSTCGCLVSRHGRVFVESPTASEDRGQAPRTEPVPVLPQSAWWIGRRKNRDRHRGRSQSPFLRSRRMLCESDVDQEISQVISMFGNRSVVQENSQRDWPRAGQLANPWPAAWPVPCPAIIWV